VSSANGGGEEREGGEGLDASEEGEGNHQGTKARREKDGKKTGAKLCERNALADTLDNFLRQHFLRAF
jgi:hypothetical protein